MKFIVCTDCGKKADNYVKILINPIKYLCVKCYIKWAEINIPTDRTNKEKLV